MDSPGVDAGLVLAIDLNPISWLGNAAAAAVGDVWKAAMIGIWSAGLWLLGLAFTIIDAFTTPDLSAVPGVARGLAARALQLHDAEVSHGRGVL